MRTNQEMAQLEYSYSYMKRIGGEKADCLHPPFSLRSNHYTFNPVADMNPPRPTVCCIPVMTAMRLVFRCAIVIMR